MTFKDAKEYAAAYINCNYNCPNCKLRVKQGCVTTTRNAVHTLLRYIEKLETNQKGNVK